MKIHTSSILLLANRALLKIRTSEVVLRIDERLRFRRVWILQPSVRIGDGVSVNSLDDGLVSADGGGSSE